MLNCLPECWEFLKSQWNNFIFFPFFPNIFILCRHAYLSLIVFAVEANKFTILNIWDFFTKIDPPFYWLYTLYWHSYISLSLFLFCLFIFWASHKEFIACFMYLGWDYLSDETAIDIILWYCTFVRGNSKLHMLFLIFLCFVAIILLLIEWENTLC